MNQYRLKAEWEQQRAIMLTWPHLDSDWRTNLAAVEQCYCDITKQISRFQQVICICQNQSTQQRALACLTQSNCDLEQVQFVIIETNDTWCRDYGPISVEAQSQTRWLDFQFNGWGDKYSAQLDNQVTRALYKHLQPAQTTLQSINFTLEGGSIDSNGEGILLTTSTCLLNPNRNGKQSKSQLNQNLQRWFSTKKIIWLDNIQLPGDDTDGHIDTLARFIDANNVVYCYHEDQDHPYFQQLSSMRSQLEAALRDSDIELHPIPLPPAPQNQEQQPLPANYANFLIINNALLLPLYGVEEDQQTMDQLQKLCPHREVIGINCRPLIEQFGSLHCITMQIYD